MDFLTGLDLPSLDGPLDHCDDWLASLEQPMRASSCTATSARPIAIRGARPASEDLHSSLESTQSILGASDDPDYYEDPHYGAGPYGFSGAAAFGTPPLPPHHHLPLDYDALLDPSAPPSYLPDTDLQDPTAAFTAAFPSFQPPSQRAAQQQQQQQHPAAAASAYAFGGFPQHQHQHQQHAAAAAYAVQQRAWQQQPLKSAPYSASSTLPLEFAPVQQQAPEPVQLLPAQCFQPQYEPQRAQQCMVQQEYDEDEDGMEVSEQGTDGTEASDATMQALHSPGKNSELVADTATAASPAARRALRRSPSTSAAASVRPQVRLRLVVKPHAKPAGGALRRASSAGVMEAAAAAAAGARRPRRAAALRSLAGAGYAEDGVEEDGDDGGVGYESGGEEVSLVSSRAGAAAAAAGALSQQPIGKKKHNPWSQEETEALIEGVRLVGVGKWAEIKKLPLPTVAGMLVNRSAVDLKDKWRNLSRVARLPKSALKSRLAKGGSDTPLELVLAVKELLDSSRADHRDWR